MITEVDMITSYHTQYTTMSEAYLVNITKKEYIQLTTFSDDWNVFQDILNIFRSYPINNRLFENLVVKGLVQSIVGRWSLHDACNITFRDMICYTKLDKYFIQAMLTVSMLNYGITFTEDEEECLKKKDKWYNYMTKKKNKRKRQHNDTIQLSCSMHDIWMTCYDELETKDLCTALCVQFTMNNREEKDSGPKIPFKKDMMSDEFVEFFKYIEVFPAQMTIGDKECSFNQLSLYFDETFGEKYELPDGASIDSHTSYDLTHPYFQKEVYFKKDLVLKHSSEHFSLLQVKGEKINIGNIIRLIAEFGNAGGYVLLYEELMAVQLEDNGNGDFNMYDSVHAEAKKQYDVSDDEGLTKETLNVHNWGVRMYS